MKRKKGTHCLFALTILSVAITIFASCSKDDSKPNAPDSTETAAVSGHCYYASTKIPVSGALVSIDNTASTTGANGSYLLDNVATGNRTIHATKEGYDDFAATIDLPSNGLLFDIDMTSAQYTHTLYGTIVSFGTQEPLHDVMVTVLNDDGSPTQLQTTSDSLGFYQIPAVPQGRRIVQYQRNAYHPFTTQIYIGDSDHQNDIQLVGYILGTVTDIDGNVYQTVQIGDQWWMAENLKVTHYRSGDPIPDVTDDSEWSSLTSGAYCDYDNNTNHVPVYGRLYNWYAVNDDRGIAPDGWHVPSDEDWQMLIGYLGGSAMAGGMMREAGTEHWSSPNIGADNYSGFTALPGGYRNPSDGDFLDMGILAYFWSSTELDDELASRQRLYHKDSDIYRGYSDKRYGFSVRCVRD